MSVWPGGGADHGAHQPGEHGEGIAPAREFGVIPFEYRVDQVGGKLGIVARQIVELHADARPATGMGAVVAQRAADPVVVGIGECQDFLDLLRAGIGAALAQLQQFAHKVLGLVGERGGDRALGEPGHAVTAVVDQLYDTVTLEHGGDDPGGQLVESDVDGVALPDGEGAGGLQERGIGVDAARIDLRVELQDLTLSRRQWAQRQIVVTGARVSAAGAGRGHVGLAALDQQCEITLVLRGVNGLRSLALLFRRIFGGRHAR